MATALIERALDAGVPARWVTADEVYGADPRLAGCLAIAGHRRLPVAAATTRTAAQMAADLPRRAWQVRSAGAGAHGPRRYAWAWIALQPRAAVPAERDAAHPGRQLRGHWWLLVRRNLSTADLAFYRCYTPYPVTLAECLPESLGSRL